MSVAWSFPTRVLFGDGLVEASLKDEVTSLSGSHALIVTDKGVAAAGLSDAIKRALGDIPSTVFDEISSNPLETEVLAATDAYRSCGADIIIGLGGGSPLDVAKLVRVAATHPLPLLQYDDAAGGDKLIINPLPPMIAIPTTAGTGSEVGRSGVVTIQSNNKKTVIFAPSMMPNVAMLDPVMTETLPPRLIAATGIDALTHCIEAYCALGDHPMADAIALGGIRLAAKHLEAAVHDNSNQEARSAMLKASMMGAVAFQKGLGACHSLAHPLGAEHNLHHGLANALCLPAVLDFNRTEVPQKIAEIARMLGVRAEDEETLAFECAGAVRSLRKKIGLPDGLASQGIEEEHLAKLAQLAVEDACHTLNPRACSAEDLLLLYRSSL